MISLEKGTGESGRQVELTIERSGKTPEVRSYDLLVVACEPRNLTKFCNFTDAELAVFDSIENYTFNTTLLKVTRAQDSSPAPFGIILKPKSIQEQTGMVGGYRNETAKQYSLKKANAMKKNLITVYQQRGPKESEWDAAKFLEVLEETLPGLDWWPYGGSYEVIKQFRTPYFDHFSQAHLKDEAPWNYLGMQGTGNTIYVHASTCFESVLQCWQYGEVLIKNCKQSLPENKDAPIAILGAGVSGMLFAHRLKNLGYTGVELLELDSRFGGKTVTVVEKIPDEEEGTACELGTCYLSPAYDVMYQELGQFFEGNKRLTFRRVPEGDEPDKEASFRGIVTEAQFPGASDPDHILKPLVGFQDYMILKGQYETGRDLSLSMPAKMEMAKEMLGGLKSYIDLHDKIMHGELPMPLKPPTEVLDGSDAVSFYSFLKNHDLLCLTGLIQYTYSIQGYGPLKDIPTYYGLVWITPPIVKAIIESLNPRKKSPPLVTYLEKGWIDVWDQMSKTLNISLDVKTLKIVRPV